MKYIEEEVFKIMRRGVMVSSLIFIILLLSMSLVSSELFLPVEQRYIETGNNSNWYYTRIQKVGKAELIGMDRNDRGAIGIGEVDGSLEIFGRMWLVPAFKHPSNSMWYLCPIRNMDTINEISDLGNGWYFDVSDSSVTCYRYDDPTLTGSADLDVKASFVTDTTDGSTKINVNTTVNGVSPIDTGFGFLFYPQDQSKYRYVYIDDTWYDLAGVEGSVPIQKVFQFFKDDYSSIGHTFDWTDMLDVGNRFSEIITLGSGGQKGLLIGTYGYGASNTIVIDPLYTVDYSPEPAEHLINGTVDLDDDNQFESHPDISFGVSDGNDSTQYGTRTHYRDRAYGFIGLDMEIGFYMDEVNGTIFNNNYNITDLYGVLYGGADPNVTGRINSGVELYGNDSYVFVNDTPDMLDVPLEEDYIACISFNTSDQPQQMLFEMTETGTVQRVFELFMLANGKIKAVLRRGGQTSTLAPVPTYDDQVWHTTCLASDGISGITYLYVDNSLSGSIGGGTGAISVSDVNLGIDDDLTQDFTGFLDEFCFWRDVEVNFTEIVNYYEVNGCGNKSIQSYTKGYAISGKWSQIYDDTYSWFLRLKKETARAIDVIVYGYHNGSSINISINTTQNLDGTGWFNIPVDSLLSYELNNTVLNYSILRFYTDSPELYYFSEVYLRKEADDVNPPVINWCSINDTYIENNEFTRLECNVTDDVDVDYVNASINSIIYDFTKNGDLYYYDFECTESTDGINIWNLTNAIDILGNTDSFNPSLNFTCLFDTINITLVDYYALNSTNGRIDNLTTDNLVLIEYLVLNYTITARTSLQNWYFNFTADGFNPCSLGNKQSSVCYNYDNDTYKYIQFIEDVDTSTYDGIQGNQGDRIIVTKSISGDNLSMNISLKIDEHYNPNVFKWYDAIYNFSDVKWQTVNSIGDERLIKVEVDQSIIPLNADQYKLDFRINHNYPVNNIEAYICNSSYTTGHPHDVDECVQVAGKYWYELQDVGTKFRAIFTKTLINGLGDIKYIILEKLNEGNTSKYYAIKTYKATASNYTTHWEYSIDGIVWNNSGDGYETELNINWFYDGAEPTILSTRLYAESLTASDYLETNIIWDIDPTNNYPPIVHILTPYDTEIIQVPYNVTYQIADTNNDNLSGNLSLYYTNGTLYTILVTGLNQSDTIYLLDENPGVYDLELKVCEIDTSELFCDSDISRITIFSPVTNLTVFPSKNPVEILEEYIMYANYTDAYGQTIPNATCYGFNSSVVGGGQANWGRGVLGIGGLPTVENAIHTEVPGIYGNDTVMIQIQDVPLGKPGYGFNFRFHAHTEHPEDDLRVYANCNNSLVFSNFTLIGTVLESEAIVTNNETILWGFKNIVAFGFPMPTSNCSIMFESYGTSETSRWMVADTNTTLNLNNAYYSDDFGESYILRNNSDTRSPFVDMAIGLSIPEQTTMTYNSTLGLYILSNIRHGRPFVFHDQFICMADGYDNATDYTDMILQDNVPPITQVVSINPDPAELLRDNVTIHWAVNDAELLASFISVRYPNESLLMQSEDDPIIIDSTYLSVIGNYSVQVFANDTGGLSSTDNETFVVSCTTTMVNTSWSTWSNETCLSDDTMNQSRYLTEYDSYFCGEVGNTTYYEYRIDGPCDYCTPNIVNTSWSNWTNIECLIDDTLNQSRYITEYDDNYCGEIGNITYYVYRDTEYCNYCSEDIVGPYYDPLECPDSAPYTQLQYYIDNDYDICCAITSLFSDCSVLYAPYVNATVNCTPLVTTIEIDVNEEVYLDDRMYFMARIDETNSTKCWSYVKKEGKILQTNPQKTEYSMSVLMRKKTEDREYFTPVKGRVNAYWTDQNIIPYDEFVLGVRCALENGSILTGEKHITHRYEDLRKVTSRSVWGAKEMSMLVITVVIVLFILGFAIYAWKK